MRKFLICILCIVFFWSVTGCTQPENNIPTGSISETTPSCPSENATAPTEGEIVQKPMVAVSVPITTETEYAQDGTAIFNYTYQNISLIVPDPEVADKVIVDFLNHVDQTAEQAESIRTAAKTDYRPGDTWNPYLCQIIYEPIRIDNSVLSLFGSYVGYSGSSHPETAYQSVNYDLVTGDVLTLSHIITPDTTADTLSQLIVEILEAQKDKSLYEGFETTVKERFAHGFLADHSWYLSSTGLCFYFSPYEIAPYSTGVVTAEIPYHQLTGILDDAYFPAEQEEANGTVSVQNYHNDILENYSQFAEVIIDEENEKILLYTEKSVYDIRLRVNLSDSNSDTIYTVFAAYGLTPGDAVVVQPEKLPLLLTYRTHEDTIHKYQLSIDPNTDSPILEEA